MGRRIMIMFITRQVPTFDGAYDNTNEAQRGELEGQQVVTTRT